MKQILVLFGGCSPEYSVSLASAYGVLTHMDRSLYQPIPVGITQEGAWRWYGGALEAIPEDRWQEEPACLPCTLRLDRGGAALLLLDGSGRTLAFDGAFPLIHGSNGEDGTLQGLFELAGVPLIGCGTLSSALCMDKDRSHKLAALAGVPWRSSRWRAASSTTVKNMPTAGPCGSTAPPGSPRRRPQRSRRPPSGSTAAWTAGCSPGWTCS